MGQLPLGAPQHANRILKILGRFDGNTPYQNLMNSGRLLNRPGFRRLWMTAVGPERVKTLSYLVCLSQCSWAWRFPEHLPRSAPVTRESVYEALWRSCSSQSRGFYAAIAFNKPSVPMIFITRFRL